MSNYLKQQQYKIYTQKIKGYLLYHTRKLQGATIDELFKIQTYCQEREYVYKTLTMSMEQQISSNK